MVIVFTNFIAGCLKRYLQYYWNWINWANLTSADQSRLLHGSRCCETPSIELCCILPVSRPVWQTVEYAFSILTSFRNYSTALNQNQTSNLTNINPVLWPPGHGCHIIAIRKLNSEWSVHVEDEVSHIKTKIRKQRT